MGILYPLFLCVFCFDWSVGTTSLFSPLISVRTPAPAAAPAAGGSRAPQRDREAAPRPEPPPDRVSVDWQTFDDTAHGLTIFYPPGWFFFDAAQELTQLEEMAAVGRAEIMTLLMQPQSTAQPDSLIGFGFAFPRPPPDLLHLNNVVLDIIPAKGLALHEFGRGAVAQLDRQVGFDVDRFDLDTGLRPNREEAVSIRFRGGVPASAASQSVLSGSRTAGWQVVLLSPDDELLLVLTFTVLGEQFDELEPLLTEMVRRVQWAAERHRPEPETRSVTIANRTMQVHAQPAPSSPVIGKVVVGGQFSMIKRDVTGNWWRISYSGQPGWVFDHLTAANMSDAPATVPVAMIERRVNVRSGPGAGKPVVGVAMPGQQFLITGKSEAGDWWRIDDNGRAGWVSDELVTTIDAGNMQVAVVKFPIPPLLPARPQRR